MGIKFKVFSILLLMLVTVPVLLLLTPQPALAFVSHIVKLKDSNGNPVQGAPVFFTSGEFDTNRICGDGADCEHDCGHMHNPCCTFDCAYWTGTTWSVSTDSHGVAVFLATTGGGGDRSIQRCSTNFNNSLIMAVPYFNGGHWHLNTISGYGSAGLKNDSQSLNDLGGSLGNNAEACPGGSKPCEGHHTYCPGCDVNNKYYRTCGWSNQGIAGQDANVAKIDTGESGGSCGHDCSGKPYNIYWEWTLSQPVSQNLTPQNLAQNQSQNQPQNQPFLALASNFLNSFRDFFYKITLANNL